MGTAIDPLPAGPDSPAAIYQPQGLVPTTNRSNTMDNRGLNEIIADQSVAFIRHLPVGHAERLKAFAQISRIARLADRLPREAATNKHN